MPVLSKILERAVNGQLNDYLTRKNLLYEFQSGFRKGFSTDTCLVNLCDHIKTEMDKGNYTGMVMIDLQKAFDCMDHSLLIRKLDAMGVGSTDWFRSYLNDRSQCTQVGGIDSDFLSIGCGVPQGSILGPLLFLCYINDMAAALRCKLSLYADDSALVYSGSDPVEVAAFLSAELDTCRKWLVDNRLSLHLGKTECILFSSRRRLAADVDFQIRVGDTAVERVASVKYLGVVLDQCLDFSVHVQGILKKAGAKLGFLYRNRSFLNTHTRRILCGSLIFSGLEYCSSSWYPGLSVTLTERLNVIRRKCARFVLDYPPRSHIGEHEFHSLHWLSFPKRVLYFTLLHAFKIRNKLAPSYLLTNFEHVDRVHSYNTRQSATNFSLAHTRSPLGSFNRHAISGWNSLPEDLKKIHSLPVFKAHLKRFLFTE